MEFNIVQNSQLSGAVSALFQVRAPALSTSREQHCEVKRLSTPVLLGDNHDATIPLGDHQVMFSVITQQADLL